MGISGPETSTTCIHLCPAHRQGENDRTDRIPAPNISRKSLRKYEIRLMKSQAWPVSSMEDPPCLLAQGFWPVLGTHYPAAKIGLSPLLPDFITPFLINWGEIIEWRDRGKQKVND